MLKLLISILVRAWLYGGVASLAVGCGFGVYTTIWLHRSTVTKGTIISLLPVSNRENNTTNYAPVFAFTAKDGQTYKVTSGVATNPPGFEIGQHVSVLYILAKPDSAKLDSFWQLWFVSIVVVGLGLFLTGVGYLLLRHERKRQRIGSPTAG